MSNSEKTLDPTKWAEYIKTEEYQQMKEEFPLEVIEIPYTSNTEK